MTKKTALLMIFLVVSIFLSPIHAADNKKNNNNNNIIPLLSLLLNSQTDIVRIATGDTNVPYFVLFPNGSYYTIHNLDDGETGVTFVTINGDKLCFFINNNGELYKAQIGDSILTFNYVGKFIDVGITNKDGSNFSYQSFKKPTGLSPFKLESTSFALSSNSDTIFSNINYMLGFIGEVIKFLNIPSGGSIKEAIIANSRHQTYPYIVQTTDKGYSCPTTTACSLNIDFSSHICNGENFVDCMKNVVSKSKVMMETIEGLFHMDAITIFYEKMISDLEERIYCTDCFDMDPPVIAFRKPDIVAWRLQIDSNGYINFEVRNFGGPLQQQSVLYQIFVDGESVEEDFLPALPVSAFDNSHTSGYRVKHKTSVRIGGTKRHVAVILDPHDTVDEINEWQNALYHTFHFTLSEDLELSDLYQVEIVGRGKEIFATVTNNGVNTTSSTTLWFAAHLGGTLKRTTATLSALNPGESETLSLGDTFAVEDGVNLEVVMAAPVGSDLDLTNNMRRWKKVDISPYEGLLANGDIADSIIWVNIRGMAVKYNDWSDTQKSDLRKEFIRLESSGHFSMTAPPAPQTRMSSVSEAHTIKRADAWAIYISYVAQGLWVEVNNVVPWSITDYPPDQLRNLFDGSMMFFPSNIDEVEDWEYPMDEMTFSFAKGSSLDWVMSWNPRIAYDFLKDSGLIGLTQLDTVHGLTAWMQNRLNHISAWDGDGIPPWESTDIESEWGYQGKSLLDSVLYPLAGKDHVTLGCSGTTGLYTAVLKTINIAVASWNIIIASPGSRAGHSRPLFLSTKKTIYHADDPYINSLSTAAPAASFFYDFPQVSDHLEREYGPYYPIIGAAAYGETEHVDCNDSICNSWEEQSTYYWYKKFKGMTYEFNPRVFIDKYQYQGDTTRIADYLTGPFAQPYFSATEQEEMISGVEKRLLDLGDGNFDQGRYLFRLNNRPVMLSSTNNINTKLRDGGFTQVGGGIIWAGSGGTDFVNGVEVIIYDVGPDNVFGGAAREEVGRAVSGERYGNGGFTLPTGLQEGIYSIDVNPSTLPPNAVLKTEGFGSVPSAPHFLPLSSNYFTHILLESSGGQ